MADATHPWDGNPGVFRCYRAGDLESPRGIFFADTYDGAWIYAHASGRPVELYEVKVRRLLVAENQYAILAKRRGVTVEAIRQEKSASGDRHWLRKLDARIMAEAKAAGYDAILYTRPTTPTAARELVAFDASACRCLGEVDPPTGGWPETDDEACEP